ncbi:hypothetical protein [Pseudomonas farris]
MCHLDPIQEGDRQYGYDNAGQLINLNYAKGGTSLGNLSYGYDNAG